MKRSNFSKYYPSVSDWDMALQKLDFAGSAARVDLREIKFDLGERIYDLGENVTINFPLTDLRGNIVEISIEDHAIDRYDGGGVYITHRVETEKHRKIISPEEEEKLPEVVRRKISELRKERESIREEKIIKEKSAREENLRLAIEEARQTWKTLDIFKIPERDRGVLEDEAKKLIGL